MEALYPTELRPRRAAHSSGRRGTSGIPVQGPLGAIGTILGCPTSHPLQPPTRASAATCPATNRPRSSRAGSSTGVSTAPTRSTTTTPAPAHYVLCMYPYPSGAAHMGHVRNYTFGDLLTRYRTMRGDAVLSPMGFDSFGLPAENAAIRTGRHPREFTDEHIEELRSSITRIGGVYDWRREVTQPRPRLHPLDPVDLPALPRGRSRLPRERAGQLVPGLPDGARQRTGRRRPLRTLRRPRRTSRPGAVVLPHHRLRPAAPRRPRRPRVARAGGHPAAQLDRALRGRRVRRCRSSTRPASRSPAARPSGCSPPVPTPASA